MQGSPEQRALPVPVPLLTRTVRDREVGGSIPLSPAFPYLKPHGFFHPVQETPSPIPGVPRSRHHPMPSIVHGPSSSSLAIPLTPPPSHAILSPVDGGAVAGLPCAGQRNFPTPGTLGCKAAPRNSKWGQVGESRPDYNRNRKHSRPSPRGTGKGRTGGARAHQRAGATRPAGRVCGWEQGEWAGSRAKARGLVSSQRRRRRRVMPG